MAGRRRFFRTVLLRLRVPLAVFGSIYVAAALGFYYLQASSGLLNSFYWAMVTLGTVGYGDIVPLSASAKLFTIVVIATQLLLFGYLLSVITGVMAEESQRRALGVLGTSFKGHVVVLGYDTVGKSAVRELLAEEQRVAVVTDHVNDIPNVHALAGETQIFVTHGAPADAEMMQRTNIAEAHSVIVCTSDDTTNLIAALNVRRLAPHVRIVVSVQRPELRETLKAAGVTYVASPGDMGGRLCASAAFRPEVANAVEDLTTAAYGADIQQYSVTEGSPLAGRALRDAEGIVRQASDCLIIGSARLAASGEYETTINPPAAFVFHPKDVAIVLGSLDNLHKLRRFLGIPQGR